MDILELKAAIKSLVQDKLEDEAIIRSKDMGLYEQGQLAATQLVRVELENLLVKSGSNRPATIENKSRS